MKYLVLFLLSFPAFASSEICKDYQRYGYGIDLNKCISHLENPKYKIGSILQVDSNEYDSSCKFQVYGPKWSAILDEPFYYGRLTCQDGFEQNGVNIIESELK